MQELLHVYRGCTLPQALCLPHRSYPSGEQKKMVAGDFSNIVKYSALGLESTACNSDLSKTVQKKLGIKEMDNELEELRVTYCLLCVQGLKMLC